MKTVLYARVSTLNNGQDVSMQVREFEEFCASRRWTAVDRYIDTGISGSKDSRPELNRLMADAKRRKFDAVVVYRFDRFARSTRHLVNALAEFNALGIQFISMHEGIDTNTPNGRLVFGIFASIAEFERDLIRERVRSGIANRKAKGLRTGRRPVKIDLDCIRQLRADGQTIRQIAQLLGISHGLVHKTLASLAA
jgi:DNA invertase Pin-like site-specific DNA recombinase